MRHELRGIIALTPRRLFAAGVAVCAVLLGVALYFEHVMRLEPCPLCMVQRVLVVLLALVMAAAALRNPRGWGVRACGALIALLGLAGTAVAGRHVYLQGLPPGQVPECGPGLGYILDAFPLGEAIGLILSGSGECAEVQWTLLGLDPGRLRGIQPRGHCVVRDRLACLPGWSSFPRGDGESIGCA